MLTPNTRRPIGNWAKSRSTTSGWPPTVPLPRAPWSKKIAEYQQRRARSVGTADSQIMLAKWCESAGLEDQAKMHWRLSMNTRPTHNQQREIISKLGLVRHQKKLMPAAEAKVLKKHEKELEAMTQKSEAHPDALTDGSG